MYSIKISEKALKFGDVDIMCLDANNLYGWVISQYLPYSKFKWFNQKEIDKFDVNLIGKNSLDTQYQATKKININY